MLLLLCYGTAWLASAYLLEMKKNAVHVEDFRRKQMGAWRALLPLLLPHLWQLGWQDSGWSQSCVTVTSVTRRPQRTARMGMDLGSGVLLPHSVIQSMTWATGLHRGRVVSRSRAWSPESEKPLTRTVILGKSLNLWASLSPPAKGKQPSCPPAPRASSEASLGSLCARMCPSPSNGYLAVSTLVPASLASVLLSSLEACLQTSTLWRALGLHLCSWAASSPSEPFILTLLLGDMRVEESSWLRSGLRPEGPSE